jgi:ACS family tartrate transporter-like MFS transporter
VQLPEDEIAVRATAKIAWRLLPLIALAYGISYMDRVNIGYAARSMTLDLHFSAAVYGFGGGLFFVSYAAMEVPSNLILERVGARRWIARIMVTWGLIAMGMMFVKTPLQFYAMRFALGLAEAGFFPGVMFYLMRWFPARERGRAVSRFYVAYPLSQVVMGAIAGALLNLQGVGGLSGWQWLFVIEGLPAVLLGVAIFFILPENVYEARFLSDEEKDAVDMRLGVDDEAPGVSADEGVWNALRDPRVWMLGLANIGIMGCTYAFNLSMPVIVGDAMGLDATHTGYLIAAIMAVGAGVMLGAGWLSDRMCERHLHLAAYLLLQAVAFPVMALAKSGPLFLVAFAVAMLANVAVQAVLFLAPGDVLRGRGAAAGIAAVGSIGMVGAFAGPWAWGVARDATGSYTAGMEALAVPYVIAALIVLGLRRRAQTMTT